MLIKSFLAVCRYDPSENAAVHSGPFATDHEVVPVSHAVPTPRSELAAAAHDAGAAATAVNEAMETAMAVKAKMAARTSLW